MYFLVPVAGAKDDVHFLENRCQKHLYVAICIFFLRVPVFSLRCLVEWGRCGGRRGGRR